MRFFHTMLMVVFALVSGAVLFSADDVAPVVAPVATAGTGAAIWAWINSSLGVTVVSGVIAFVLARIFTARPAWKVIYDKYRPLLLQGVKYAEKQIPDGTPNQAMLRLDMALKYAIQLDGAISTKDEAAVRQAIDVVHAEAETGRNI